MREAKSFAFDRVFELKQDVEAQAAKEEEGGGKTVAITCVLEFLHRDIFTFTTW